MRSLNDYFIPMGNIDLGGSTDTTNIVCIPDGGLLVGISYNTSEAIDVLGTASMLVDGSDNGSHFTFPVTAVDTGGVGVSQRTGLRRGPHQPAADIRR